MIDTTRVLVTGGRDLVNYTLIFTTLDDLHHESPIKLLIHGACPTGVDDTADSWAQLRQIDRAIFPANFARHNKSAGPIRNQRMLDLGRPTLVVAFPGGNGTVDMTRRARETGIEILKVEA